MRPGIILSPRRAGFAILPGMDPDHIMLGAFVILGITLVVGGRVILRFYRQQREAESRAAQGKQG